MFRHRKSRERGPVSRRMYESTISNPGRGDIVRAATSSGTAATANPCRALRARVFRPTLGAHDFAHHAAHQVDWNRDTKTLSSRFCQERRY